MEMTTMEMLEKLQHSANEIVAAKAQKILYGDSTIEEEIKYAGSFMA